MADDRLDRMFVQARSAHRAALIGYLVGGDPDLPTSELVIRAVAAAGLDLLELGVPYGDPVADGPTIAAAGQRALTAGMTLDQTFDLVERVQELLPVVLFTYYNPVFRYGVERFAARAAAAGASGVIIPDITLEEIDEVRGPLSARNLSIPLLVSPTTAPARAGRIAAASQGFVYVVSRMGVTGASSEPDLVWLRAQVARLRQATATPLAVGFGISTPEQVGAVSAWSDAVIVGSGLVGSYAGSLGEVAAQQAGSYVHSLTAALAGPA
ncbi:MAG: tryptophan synthase subunit alpha [Candidatus Dormiibacterota bacterium]